MTIRVRLSCATALLLVLACSTAAFAQDTAKAGFSITTANAVGVLWHVSDRVALRPELGFSTATVENSVLSAKATSSILSPAIAALFYTGPRADFRLYVSPRYAYLRSRSESTSPINNTEQTTGTHTISGSAGAEYSPHRRFGMFGELGVAFGRTKVGPTTNQSWTLRSLAGVIVYF